MRSPSFIIILTQDTQHLSVQIAKAIQKKIKNNHRLLILNISHIKFSGNYLFIENGFFQQALPLSKIALVINRAWNARDKALAICKTLERKGSTILNDSEFMEWSHSKIKQFRTAPHLFPRTLCFDPEFIEATQSNHHEETIEKIVMLAKSRLHFPVVFKTSEGCSADGIFLARTENELVLILDKVLSDPIKSVSKGLLLQHFISTHVDPSISNYYRLNLVNGKLQSAVQFQLEWKETPDGLIKLFDFQKAHDIPVDLTLFSTERVNEFMQHCVGKANYIGIDVVIDSEKQMWLLEYNDAPVVSQIVALGERYANHPQYAMAARACCAFPDAIADACIEMLQKQQKVFLTSKL